MGSLATGGATALAGVLALQNPTATLSQTDGAWPVSRLINGIVSDSSDGWAIFDWSSFTATAQTAAMETVSDLTLAPSERLRFTLYQDYRGFTVGRFRLSVTADDRSTFADGLDTGGDVSATWTVLVPLAYTSTAGATMARLGDDSLLVGPAPGGKDIYAVEAATSLTGITGIRLELLEDPSLPFSGPGYGNWGNAVIAELRVEVVPEPKAVTLVTGLGLVSLALWRRRRG